MQVWLAHLGLIGKYQVIGIIPFERQRLGTLGAFVGDGRLDLREVGAHSKGNGEGCCFRRAEDILLATHT